jgi:N-acetylglucosamine kinase-like BadF-type ATPase
MSYFLGIDAGGTKTICALADDDQELARVSGSTIKPSHVGEELAAAELSGLLQQAAQQVGVPLSEIDAVCLGIAGFKTPGCAEWANGVLRSLVQGACLVCEDVDIALDAAFLGSAGVLVISGTGSNVLARNEAGILAQAGGLGHVISDEGSGCWIGRQAVSRLLFAHQGGDSEIFLQELMARCKCNTPQALEYWGNHVQPVEFSTLVSVVHDAAVAGDHLAKAILAEAGRELARLVTVAIGRLPADTQADITQTAYSGSILENIPLVRDTLRDNLPPDVTLMDQPADPVQGALWRARNAYAGRINHSG